MTATEALLTVAEVASILRCGKVTVYRMIRRGQLRALRIGSHYRVKRSDFMDYLAGGAMDFGGGG